MTHIPEFSISILTYTALPLAKRCIESVMAGGGDFDLHLTDNGGAPEVGRYFDDCASRFANVHVTHNLRNLGFIAPNRAVFYASKSKYHILLNDDTVVPPGWLNLLKAPFAADPRCAMTGPAGGCGQLRSDFHGEAGPRFEYLEGSMLCMDREKVAALEPHLFHPELEGAYGEDSYLSLRMREAGYNLHRVAIAYTHYRGCTSAVVPQCREWQEKNHAFLQRRFVRYILGHSFEYPTIVKRNAAWGDVLLTTPIIRALKKLRPMSPIWVETSCPEVFNGNPDVARVSRTPLPQPPAHILVNLNGVSEMRPATHILDAYAACADVHLNGEKTTMHPERGDIEWAERIVPRGELWVAIHPGPTAWRCKNWPADRWQKVVSALHTYGAKVVLVGADTAPQMTSDLDLRGRTTVAQLAAVLGAVTAFAGVDSFPIHVAQAMGTPVVGLFGITSAKNILTSASPWVACESPSNHPAAGLRHRVVGKSLVDHPQNPMDAIETISVISALFKTLDSHV